MSSSGSHPPRKKIELARMGLGLSQAEFRSDGDAKHVHDVIMGMFPVLLSVGGYSLLRLAENSHSMVEIEGPDGGTTVPYQAKLYVRPLQRDISEEDMKDYSIVKVCSSQSNGGMVLSVVHILLLLCNTVLAGYYH